jgi:hypothetical protein
MAAPTNTAAKHPAADSEAARVVTRFLTGFYRGDFDLARSVVAEDFAFEGPFLQVTGKGAFFEGAAGLQPVVRGHRMLRQWSDGGEVCSIYEVDLVTPAGEGAVLMSEWHTVHDGILAAGRVVFDTVAFRRVLPPR